jgi:hypothetical protein
MIFGRSVPGPVIKQSEVATLFSIYSFGFAGIYLAFTLLYLHAWRLRDALGLSEIEKLETRYIIYRVLAVAVFGLIPAALALTSWSATGDGLIYLLLIPILRGFRIVHRRRRAALLSGMH